MRMRLQKILAESGVTSRRKAEELIKAGRVSVNGVTMSALGSKADPERDQIFVDGEQVLMERKVYIKLYKPTGYISSRSSKEGKSVLRLLKNVPERVYPVGRLDKESEGLIILTNDGEYALEVMHPRFEHEKEYVVQLDVPIKQEHVKRIEAGLRIHGVKLNPMKITAIRKKGTELQIVLNEGKKRQLRRVFGKFGYAVTSLKRIRIGDVKLGSMKPRQWKYFKP